MGVSTSIGAFLFGIVILSKSQQCMISRQYLLQTSIFGIGKLFIVAGNVEFSLSGCEKNDRMRFVVVPEIQFFNFLELISYQT